jgi:hypothetical protein
MTARALRVVQVGVPAIFAATASAFIGGSTICAGSGGI